MHIIAYNIYIYIYIYTYIYNMLFKLHMLHILRTHQKIKTKMLKNILRKYQPNISKIEAQVKKMVSL